jgi:hypothetical protein
MSKNAALSAPYPPKGENFLIFDVPFCRLFPLASIISIVFNGIGESSISGDRGLFCLLPFNHFHGFCSVVGLDGEDVNTDF